MASPLSFKPPASRWMPREGFYIDPLAKILSKSVLHPAFTGVVWFALKYYPRKIPFFSTLSSNSSTTILQVARILTILGSVFWTNQYLNLLTNNNFVLAKKWDPEKELVLITGGSGGIGASVARRLAKEGTQVIVVDILPLDFDDRESHKFTRERNLTSPL